MDTKKSIDALQFFVTGLTEGAIVHRLQGQALKAAGFAKLGDKFLGHYAEEMGWVEKMQERILDLGGKPVFEGCKCREIVEDPVEYIKADLEIQEKGVPMLRDCALTLTDDPLTYDILKAYLADEEEDLYWLRGQLELCAKIGQQNFLASLI